MVFFQVCLALGGPEQFRSARRILLQVQVSGSDPTLAHAEAGLEHAQQLCRGASEGGNGTHQAVPRRVSTRKAQKLGLLLKKRSMNQSEAMGIFRRIVKLLVC